MVAIMCKVPHFIIAVLLTQLGVILQIVNFNDNTEYKIPWLFIVLIVPVAGFMIYFMYYLRKLSKKFIKLFIWRVKLLCNKILQLRF